MKIEEIDRNFATASVDGQKVIYKDVTTAPFSLEGFAWFGKDRRFARLPSGLTKEEVNEGALFLGNQTAGGAVRFRTDSRIIVLRAELAYSSDMNHMPRAGSAGFDIYRGKGSRKVHFGTAQPSRDQKVLEVFLARLPESEERAMNEWTVNFPLYGGAEKVEIGLEPGSRLEAPTPHKVKDPVLFYGSSITQGGCASRPGNAYTSMLCRAVDAPQINLGFSGAGRGEKAVAELIAGLKLSCFVMDYDYNAPTPEHLKETHEIFFRTIRKKQPDLPVIIMSLCNVWPDRNRPTYENVLKRRAIILETYEHAVAAGDRKVWFIDGATLFGKDGRFECTVDGCHPNDLGFYRMYRTVLPVLRKALKAL